MHHGRNPEYIDRNHAGMFIVWDRMFGTFEPERAPVVYGITTPLRSWNPLWANAHYWVELGSLARRATTPGDRLRLFLKPPGWRPASMGGPVAAPAVDAANYEKFDTPLARPKAAYVLLQFLVLLAASTWLLFHQQELGGLRVAVAAAFIGLSLLALGFVLEGRRHATAIECARLFAGALLVLWFVHFFR